MMRINVGLVVFALSVVFLKCVSTQGPNYIWVRDLNGVTMFMNHTTLSVRRIDAKETVHTAKYTRADVTTDHHEGNEVKVSIGYSEVNKTSSPELKVSKFNLTMIFENDGVYWFLKNSTAILEGTEVGGTPFTFTNSLLLSEIGLYAPSTPKMSTWSFHCTQFGPLYPAEPNNHTFSIEFRGFQIQPFMNTTTTNDKPSSFSQPYECVGFFSIGILSGIFVTLILMAILAWGLAMIMDVKTMDRFDDPKGKPISFAGNE